MILKNAKIVNENFDLAASDIAVSGQRIARIAPGLRGDESIDLAGCLIVPGFVDIHIHGCVGADTCDGTRESLAKMAGHLLTEGVTSFCPTTMTVSLPELRKALSAVRDCMEHPPEGASVRGVNMEGPYISPERRGAQKEEYVRTPDWKEFKTLFDDFGGIIKLVDLAPEREGGLEFIDHVSRFCRVSLAHTEADYGQVKEAFARGMTHVTHLFNAMNGLHHRRPGAVGAVFDDRKVKAEIICDGFHIHPAVLRTAFRILGEDRTVVVSDSMRAAGMPDGVSELGGQKVFAKSGEARLENGTIAGSTTNIRQEVKNLIQFGIPLRQAVKSATINPAKEIGAEKEIGSIQTGKLADLVVLDPDWKIVSVVKSGKWCPVKP
ncbi:MAG: N-acetylglucosamine-6-phosphate deacetylase [Oscillospiraceae bacterium]|jgi:N-acetylglucosamine-6-phosphate deacetylase|nr:N-acetylglucosamine-6-phosphate deacetylase [Oscillospiraceae bacterium]MCI1991030.1 N-acetylglucosamine-6-phosphate deacetylase [Oscillospiraceae bacterium]MCI2035319.1 N-acetylglucosamine-6-phosphate deacetylase [Oscillospiraceae bacterium]